MKYLNNQSLSSFGAMCRELTQNSQPVINKKIEKTHAKIIFTWFGNLFTFTEL